MDDLTTSDSETEQITKEVLTRRRRSSSSRQGDLQEFENKTSRQSPPTTASSTTAAPSGLAQVQEDDRPQTRWKKVVETLLVLSTLILTAWKTPLVYHHSYQKEIASWSWVTLWVLIFRHEYSKFPQTLYLLLFPPIISLATEHADLLPLNLTLSLAALPLTRDQVRLLSIVLSMNDESRFWIIEFHTYICDIISWVCSTSLTYTEVSLFASLLVNLVYSFNPQEYSQVIILVPLFAFIPATPWLIKLVRLSQIIAVHKRPPNHSQLKVQYASFASVSFAACAAVLAWAIMGPNGLYELIDYLFSDLVHLEILGYWTALLSTAIPLVMRYSAPWKLDLRRKVWHGVVVLMFLPTLCVDWVFCSISMSIAIVLFILVEVIRATALPPFGTRIHQILLPYTDPRDMCGPIIVSHLFLLLGISIPAILCRGSPAGVICLGLGDAAASIVGRRYGKQRPGWLGSPKTIEGTASFIVMVVAGLWTCSRVLPYVRLEFMSLQAMVVTAVCTATLEATSGMNDNVIVPLYMLIILELLI